MTQPDLLGQMFLKDYPEHDTAGQEEEVNPDSNASIISSKTEL